MSAVEQPDERRQEPTKDAGSASLLRKGFDIANRYLTSRGSSSLAPAADPRTPPSRLIPSNYSSPGSTFGKDEDAVLIEITPRYLLAGMEGESSPQCKISFTPDTSRRVGDYREWTGGEKTSQESRRNWGGGYELWRNDIQGLDLDIMGNKLERAVQEIHNKYLLSDAGSSRLILVAPSLVPHPVLEAMLFALFECGRYPSITLLPAPMTAAVAAGLRSALVIDIGWEETVITSLYECREIHSHRTVRAMKALTSNTKSALRRIARTRPELKHLRSKLSDIEELLVRGLSTSRPAEHSTNRRDQAHSALVADGVLTNMGSNTGIENLEVDWSVGLSSEPIRIPKSVIFEAVERTFLEAGTDPQDDEEMTLTDLAFMALKCLSSDVRSLCISRIVFTGEGSKLPLLKLRVLSELRSLVEVNGWSHIKGTHAKTSHAHAESPSSRLYPADAKFSVPLDANGDNVEYQVRKRKPKLASTGVSSEVAEVESLGSWAGASLLTSLRVKGLVEIERDRFLSHGLMGANREYEISVSTQPQRVGIFGAAKGARASDKSNWTLAGWG